MLYAGVLKHTETAGKEGGPKVAPLLTTTSTGNVWKPSGPFELHSPDPEVIRRAVPEGIEPVMVACRISGRLTTNFPDGPPPVEDGTEEEDVEEAEEEPEVEHLSESKETSVIVVSDVDMISDMLAYRETFFGMAQIDDNASFLLNSLDYLSGTSDLIAIRSRGRFQKPFELVDRIEQEAEEATAAEVEIVNAKIREFQNKLDELGEGADDENAGLLRSEAITERRKIEEEMRKARKEQRKLNAGKREAIESLGATLQTVNIVLAPAAVLLIAIAIAVVRYAKARRYAARRED
jgi:ABC-type uncharacterized transport system involved in gliding motility auxiliary subunit